eukprot:9492554-Pyramimonas_sp.AAC.2
MKGLYRPLVKEQVAKYLTRVKAHLLGSDGSPATGTQEVEVVQAIVREGTPPLLSLLVTKLPFMAFEERKDAVQIFNGVLHSYRAELPDGVEFVLQHPDLLTEIACGYVLQLDSLSHARLRCIKISQYKHDHTFMKQRNTV